MALETINFDYLGLQDNDRLLDLGCGEGRHALSAYILKNIDAVGVDLKMDDLRTTAERYEQFAEPDNNAKHLMLSIANGMNLPFADNSFDKVICSEVLEHIPDYRAVLKEIVRVLKVGGVFAVSVPRFFPEWVCWQLSDEYHEVEGGHIRIFNASHLREDIEQLGMIHFRRHWAHSLHVPYWWLKCLLWRGEHEEAAVVRGYHKFLVWDLMKRPALTRGLDSVFNPVMGKSVVMYFVKGNRPATEAKVLEKESQES